MTFGLHTGVVEGQAPPPGAPGLSPALRSSVAVPWVVRTPNVDLLGDQDAHDEVLAGFATVSGFVQRLPSDGRPADQPTTAYLGFDDRALHVVFVAYDARPDRIRARLAPRENIGDDDVVTLMLDTDDDGRRAYTFRSNARGIQWDALFAEGSGFDESFDTVWESTARIADWGYVVHMAIPFRSLRFDSDAEGRWGIVLSRQLARDSREETYWPRVTSSVEGTLTQAGALLGVRATSPSRNVQAIPYTTWRAFRALDTEAVGGPAFHTDTRDVGLGGDVKAVLDERFVLDLTANPDFSQVESDRPQLTANERFEIFFPERRPFFTENADYFRTPISLLFSRRISDPRLGARFTGKAGPWGVGAMVLDDEGPETERAWFTASRVTRDIGDFSTIGAMYVGRDFAGAHNRAGGLDARIRVGHRWRIVGHTAWTRTSADEAAPLGGQAVRASVTRADRRLFLSGSYMEIDSGFDAQAGFVPRTDMRQISHFSSFFWRPEGGVLTSWGPEFSTRVLWDHSGQLLENRVEGSLEWNFIGDTGFEVNVGRGTDRLRPSDNAALGELRAYDTTVWDIEFRTNSWHWLSIDGNYGWGTQINFSPPPGAPPTTSPWTRLSVDVDIRPTTRLRVENTLLWSRLHHPGTGTRIFADRVVRSGWNWQWSRALSIRAILQYENRSVDAELTSLRTRRNLNADLLVTYRLSPWTAIYAGFNGNAHNHTLVYPPDSDRELVATERLHPENGQIFIKASYLLRF